MSDCTGPMTIPLRQPRLLSRRLLRRLAGAAAVMLLAAAGRADPRLPAATGLSDPGLAFGLSRVSDWSSESPFLDLMKSSRSWVGHSKAAWSAMKTGQLDQGGYLDADGWPTRIPDGLTSVGTIWAWGNSTGNAALSDQRAGVYVLDYTGAGTLKLTGDVKILSSKPGEIVFQNLHGGTMEMNIVATDPAGTGDYIRDVSVVAQKYEGLHQAGAIFNPDWLALVGDARELRFMDWMQANGSKQSDWADRPRVDDATWTTGNGVPVEVMVALANQTGTEPWFNMPAKASDAYIRQFASYVRDHLDPALKAHVEYSNETWNFSFAQTKWLDAQAKAAWGEGTNIDYLAKRATETAVIWDQVFGAQADARVDNVLGIQTGSMANFERTLKGALWQKHEPGAFVDPASVFDSAALTTYFGGAPVAKAGMRADLLAQIKASPAEATAWLAEKLMDPGYKSSIPQIEKLWTQSKTVADKYGLDLTAYEGGQHVQHSFGIGGMSQADLATLTQFLTGFVRSPEMGQLYDQLWQAWAKVGDGPFMQFGDVEVPSKSGSWGLLSSLDDENPRATVLLGHNQTDAAWFGDGGGARYQQGAIRIAGDGGEVLTGTQKSDYLIGGAGDDVLIGGTGQDGINGGGGTDTLVLAGSAADYTLSAEGAGYRLTGPGTSDFVRDVETFRFDTGKTLTLNQMLRH